MSNNGGLGLGAVPLQEFIGACTAKDLLGPDQSHWVVTEAVPDEEENIFGGYALVTYLARDRWDQWREDRGGAS